MDENLKELLRIARIVDAMHQPHQNYLRDDVPIYGVNGAMLTVGDLRALRKVLQHFPN